MIDTAEHPRGKTLREYADKADVVVPTSPGVLSLVSLEQFVKELEAQTYPFCMSSPTDSLCWTQSTVCTTRAIRKSASCTRLRLVAKFRRSQPWYCGPKILPSLRPTLARSSITL